jgi:hypothetical protein
VVCRARGIGGTLEWRRKQLADSDLRRALSGVALLSHWADMANVVTKLLPNHQPEMSREINAMAPE